MTSCSVCTEPFNKSTKKIVHCQKCDFLQCKTCVQRYLLELANDPHCMNCKHKWDQDSLLQQLGKTFVRKQYRDKRKQILFDLERSQIPSTMDDTQKYLQVNEIKRENVELAKQKRILQRQLSSLINRIYQNNSKKWNLIHGKKKEQFERKEFIHACPLSNCKGFLSSAWKCPVCLNFICQKCNEVKGLEKNCNHVCNEDTSKTIALIKNNSKPCPKCAWRISKINGCDQMFCTQCKTAFSWRTGRIINGVIHNPHFFQWQRENNNGVAPRVPGDGGNLQCNQFPTWYLFHNKIAFLRAKNRASYDSICYLYRNIAHLRHWEIPQIQDKIETNSNNKTLRIRYILNEINEKQFKTSLCRKDNARSKFTEIQHVYELLNTVCTEQIIYLFNHNTEENITKCLKLCENLRNYVNKQLKKISITFNQTVGIIDPMFRSKSVKFKS